MTQDELVELSKEMNAQDNRATQLPLFVVQRQIKRYGDSEFCSDHERKDIDSIDTNDLCESCLKSYDETGDFPEECDYCDNNTFVWFTVEWEFDLHHGVFLTAKACDEYIKRRYYEVGKGARSYGISSYWSYDMAKVLEHLSSLSTEDGKPVSQYRT